MKEARINLFFQRFERRYAKDHWYVSSFSSISTLVYLVRSQNFPSKKHLENFSKVLTENLTFGEIIIRIIFNVSVSHLI